MIAFLGLVSLAGVHDAWSDPGRFVVWVDGGTTVAEVEEELVRQLDARLTPRRARRVADDLRAQHERWYPAGSAPWGPNLLEHREYLPECHEACLTFAVFEVRR